MMVLATVMATVWQRLATSPHGNAMATPLLKGRCRAAVSALPTVPKMNQKYRRNVADYIDACVAAKPGVACRPN